MKLYLNNIMEEAEEDPIEGKMLIARRALCGLATQEKKEQSESIFDLHVQYEKKHVPSSLIGGFINVPTKSLVDELNLLTIPQPSLFTIKWLN